MIGTAGSAEVGPRRSGPAVLLAAVLLAGGLLGGCAGPAPTAAGAVPPPAQPPPPPRETAAPVRLGAVQEVQASDSFGSGGDVLVTAAVLAVRDPVAPPPAPRPAMPGARWASALVRLCRSAPVTLGYPAWVLGDDDGRTAQQSRVQHPQFPRPALPAAGGRGCTRGWVTWVVPPDLRVPTKVTFEQTRRVPGEWRLR